jgi:hypothetical protein
MTITGPTISSLGNTAPSGKGIRQPADGVSPLAGVGPLKAGSYLVRVHTTTTRRPGTTGPAPEFFFLRSEALDPDVESASAIEAVVPANGGPFVLDRRDVNSLRPLLQVVPYTDYSGYDAVVFLTATPIAS